MKQFMEPKMLFVGYYHKDEVDWMRSDIRLSRKGVCQYDKCYLPPPLPPRK